MADIHRGDALVHTVGDLPELGSSAPDFELVGADMTTFTADDFAGRRLVLNIFPSIDTQVCAKSVRRFNELATSMDNTVVLCVSADLPFAQQRFGVAEGTDDVVMGSTFRSSFGDDYGVRMLDGNREGLLARAVLVLDEDRRVIHRELVPDLGSEPDYKAALAALG